METLSYQKEVKANKDHSCNLCCEKIRKDETYYSSTHKNNGSIYSFKTHKHCSEIADRLKMYKDCDGGTSEELSEEGFQERIHFEYGELMFGLFEKDDLYKYRTIIKQLENVRFRDKLNYVIDYYAFLDKNK